MNSTHLGPEGGQVRTNNFNDFIWTLREFHFQPGPDVLPRPVPVAESPNGELWNDLSSLAQGPACRESFLEAMGGLLGNNLAAMTFPVAEECKDAESPNDFFRQDYQLHLGSGSFEFVDQIEQRIAGTASVPLTLRLARALPGRAWAATRKPAGPSSATGCRHRSRATSCT
jgi:hypothetical protein